MPRPEVVKKALEEIRKRTANYEYFFDRLKSPDWIEPLFGEGMFQDPPQAKREGDYISFPIWPESRYLARMAPSAPKLVLDVALKIPETENARVHEDLADAACSMPPELAAHWANKEAKWVRSQRYLYVLLPEKLGELVSHLARGNQIEPAVNLAQALLAILPDPHIAEETEEGEKAYRMSLDPWARFDTWHFGQILERYVPDLVQAAGENALTLLCDLLANAVRFSRQMEDKESVDHSYMWRPAIEEHSQNRPRGLKELLVSAVRDAAETLMDTKGKAVLKIIESYPLKVFQRIGLHLRRKWPEADPKGTGNLVTDPNVFDDVHLHHEFFHLLREQFKSLPMRSQQAYLDLVAQGTDAQRERWLNFRERESGYRPSQKEAESYVRHWQYTKLWPIQAFLDTEWRRRFEALEEEFGELDHPDFLVYMGALWHGPTSPKSSEDLRLMSVKELIGFLTSWRPSGERMSPSPEGLGRELTDLVASEPARFATEAERFRELNPTYVRALLSGFHEAAKRGSTFPWQPILRLCHWVVDQPREFPEQESEEDIDPGWGWTRKAIAGLLSIGFETDATEIPFGYRNEAWEILEPLTVDPEPTLEYEARYGGPNMDPATLSINTVRGEAMHAVMRYALWVRRYIEKDTDGKERIMQDFSEMPEVQKVLDHHLDLNCDPTLTIRAVYGQWLPWLVLLDPNWAARNMIKIFPLDESLRTLHDAAWETYIIFCAPYDNTFDLLREEYGRAIGQISTVSSEGWSLANPDERLAEHLMNIYWRGKLDLHDENGLLAQFYAKAHDPLCGHAFTFVGHSLHDTQEAVPFQILERLQALWLQRIRIARSATSNISHTAELTAFGWWFASAKFDDAWSITQLKDVLNLTGKVEPDHLVVERLAELALAMPMAAIECLRLIVEGDKEGWHIHGWSDQARTILAIALQSADDTARQATVDFVHWLGARGFWAFRDLLSGIKS